MKMLTRALLEGVPRRGTKEWYREQARKKAAKEFSDFNAAQYAEQAILEAKRQLSAGTGQVLDNFGDQAEPGSWRAYMAQNIDHTNVDAITSAEVDLMNAAMHLKRAWQAGVEGAQDAMNRVMDFRLSILPDDDS